MNGRWERRIKSAPKREVISGSDNKEEHQLSKEEKLRLEMLYGYKYVPDENLWIFDPTNCIEGIVNKVVIENDRERITDTPEVKKRFSSLCLQMLKNTYQIWRNSKFFSK